MADEFTIESRNDEGVTHHFAWLPDGSRAEGYGEEGLRGIGTQIRRALLRLGSKAEFDSIREEQIQAYAASLEAGVKAVFNFRGSDFLGGAIEPDDNGKPIDTIDPDDLNYAAAAP
jgi:hypothetical protein